MNSGSCFLKMQVYSVHSIPCICVGRHKLQQFQWASEACPFLPETMLFILASRWVFLTILAFFTATSKTFPPNLLQICRNKSIISWCFFITMPWKLPYFGVFLSCQVFSHLLEFCLLFLGFFSYESCSAVFLLVFPSSCWKKVSIFEPLRWERRQMIFLLGDARNCVVGLDKMSRSCNENWCFFRNFWVSHYTILVSQSLEMIGFLNVIFSSKKSGRWTRARTASLTHSCFASVDSAYFSHTEYFVLSLKLYLYQEV